VTLLSVTKPPIGLPTVVKVIPYALVPALYGLGLVTISGYGRHSSLASLLVLTSLLGLASVGQTLTMILGGIDLSIPSVIGLADVAITQLYGRGWSFWAAFVLILAVAGVVGAVNALLAVGLRVHPLVITLGTGAIVLGGVLTWTHGQNTGTVPGWLVQAVSTAGRTGPIPLPVIVFVWIAVSVLVIAFQRRTRLGRETYAAGANIVAARLTLVRTTRVWVAAYVLSALLAAVTGVLLAGFSGAANSSVGQPYLFETITAVVIGGTSLLGGSGGYGRTITGALIISQLTTLLIGAGLDTNMQEAFLGVLVILLVALYGREAHISTRI